MAAGTPLGAPVLTLDRLADLTDADRGAVAALGRPPTRPPSTPTGPVGTSNGTRRAELVALCGRLGWRSFASGLVVRQRGEVADFTLNGAMTLAVRAAAPAAGTIDLCGPPW